MTMHSGIYILVLMLSVRSGSSAPHGWKCDRNVDKNVKSQVDRINEILKKEMAQYKTSQMTNNEIPSENECKESRCGVVNQLFDYYSCRITFPTDVDNQTQIDKEMHGLIQHFKILRYSKEETCNLPDSLCPSEIKQLSMWNKIRLLQSIMMCLQKHICSF